jgi:hypothetical protein
MDQWLVAALMLVAFMAFVVIAYIFHEERKSRLLIEQPPQPDTIETRARRAF